MWKGEVMWVKGGTHRGVGEGVANGGGGQQGWGGVLVNTIGTPPQFTHPVHMPHLCLKEGDVKGTHIETEGCVVGRNKGGACAPHSVHMWKGGGKRATGGGVHQREGGCTKEKGGTPTGGGMHQQE